MRRSLVSGLFLALAAFAVDVDATRIDLADYLKEVNESYSIMGNEEMVARYSPISNDRPLT